MITPPRLISTCWHLNSPTAPISHRHQLLDHSHNSRNDHSRYTNSACEGRPPWLQWRGLQTCGDTPLPWVQQAIHDDLSQARLGLRHMEEVAITTCNTSMPCLTQFRITIVPPSCIEVLELALHHCCQCGGCCFTYTMVLIGGRRVAGIQTDAHGPC